MRRMAAPEPSLLLRNLPALLFVFALPVLCACAAAPAGAEAPVVASVIVKPRAPADEEAIVRLARAALGTAAGVRYARPLAGDAHLLYLTAPASREQVPALVERMRGSAGFQYVELDSMMKIQ